MTNSGLIQGKSPTAQNAEPWQCLCSHPSSQQLPLGQQTSPSHQVLPFSEVGMAGNHLLELVRRSWAVLSWSWGGGRTGPAVPALSPAPNFQLFLLQPLCARCYKGIDKSFGFNNNQALHQKGLENSPAACHMSLGTQRQKEGPQLLGGMQICTSLFWFSALLVAETPRGFSRAQSTPCAQRNPKFRMSQWKFFVLS